MPPGKAGIKGIFTLICEKLPSFSEKVGSRMVSLMDININRSDKPDSEVGDEAFCLPVAEASQPAELASDTPGPDFRGGDERRLQVRAHNHWLSLVSGSELPAVEDLQLELLGDMTAHGVLLDLTLGTASPAIIFLGERLAQECGDGVELFSLGDVPSRSLLSQLTDHCLEVAANRAPVGFDVGFADRGGRPILARGILLPFSSNGKVADFIFGVISWKEDTTPAITPHDQVEPVQPAPAPTPTPTPANLAALLAQARKSALVVRSGEERSRGAYYDAISAAYDFALAAANDPCNFARLLQAAALTVRPQAPLAPVARLVFGPDYNKTRIAEITAAVVFGHRQGLERGGLGALLRTTTGGLKALVAKERQFRRSARSGISGRRPELSPAIAAKLRKLHKNLPINRLGSGEFALFVARRDFAGGVALIGDLSDNTPLLEAAARRLLAQ